MEHRYLAAVVVLSVCVEVSACGGSKSPVAPAAGVTGLTITLAGGGPIYIGAVAQLQAMETLSDGTTRAAAAAWSSDTPAVATVSQSGIATAVAAGESTIAADANGRQGTLRIRIYPNFNGMWRGAESFNSCDDTGAFEGLCNDPDVFTQGEQFLHESRYVQTGATVNMTVDLGDGTLASGPGVVTVPGELQMSSARAVPEDPNIKIDILDVRFRSDVAARLTGTYRARFSAPGVEGSVVIGIRLETVTRTAGTATASRGRHDAGGAAGRFLDSLRRKMVARGTRPT